MCRSPVHLKGHSLHSDNEIKETQAAWNDVVNVQECILTRDKRNVRNILMFVRLCSICSTIFRKEYSFSKKGRVYMRKPCSKF